MERHGEAAESQTDEVLEKEKGSSEEMDQPVSGSGNSCDSPVSEFVTFF